MAADDDGLTLGAGQAPAGAESRGGGGTAEQLPEPPGSEDRHDETRPPPLHLESRNSAEPPPASAAAAADAAGAGGDGAAGGRGAHVDVSVFKYQPGVQTPMENFQNYRINLRGAALTGGLMAPAASSAAAGGGGAGGGGGGAMSGTVDIVGEYERRKGTPVERHFIKDHRAKQLLVVPNDDKFVAVAAPEAFSRHSGTCMILGGQGAYSNGPNKAYELRVGSFLRIGSVGVVVSETHTGPGGVHKCLSWEELTCLKGDIAAIQKDLVTLEALTAQEEGGMTHASSPASTGAAAAAAAAADRKMCYMCFDDEDEADNPLVAPCDCKGDTRYVHLGCLQKWHTTTLENKVCVVLNNKGVRVCTVCKSPYKASVRLPTGDSVSLFESPLPPPYICFMVVTKHQNNEDLFSTKYQLSFSSVVNRAGTGSSRGLIIGRSRQCDMVLDYRTVSTRHAMVKFAGGAFHFADLMSSNGSYLYLREPLQLPYGETVFLKWGSNVVSLKAKRSIRHRLSTLVGRRAPRGGGGGAAAGSTDFSILESLCEMGQSIADAAQPGGSDDELGGADDAHDLMGDGEGDADIAAEAVAAAAAAAVVAPPPPPN
ncbi:hypothetical protein JKP88DRAFT_202330 [Tribonema minus]|uniref:Uncharacterized protein n=1 Tax=Tribonema minus TaxID=303371 RepID=A0A836C9Y1_9STRA|nr:hypothetical protein JKP88DRAFT_202330 [Tribonema minus]